MVEINETLILIFEKKIIYLIESFNNKNGLRFRTYKKNFIINRSNSNSQLVTIFVLVYLKFLPK